MLRSLCRVGESIPQPCASGKIRPAQLTSGARFDITAEDYNHSGGGGGSWRTSWELIGRLEASHKHLQSSVSSFLKVVNMSDDASDETECCE